MLYLILYTQDIISITHSRFSSYDNDYDPYDLNLKLDSEGRTNDFDSNSEDTEYNQNGMNYDYEDQLGNGLIVSNKPTQKTTKSTGVNTIGLR